MRKNRHPYTTALLVVAASVVMHAAPLAAQTLFAWPDTIVDVAAYTNTSECLAATDRIRKGIKYAAWAPVWRDTMPEEARWHLEPLSPSVMQAAQRCAARFDVHTAPLSDFALLAKLYLQAGRDADVSTLLARRLEEIGEKNEVARAMVLDTVFHLYLDAQPVRLASAETILQRPEWEARDRIDRLVVYARMAMGAITAGDSARARRVSGDLLAGADSLTSAERHSRAFRIGLQAPIYALLLLLNRDQLLDSLRQSTAAYLRATGRLWARLARNPAAMPPGIGEHAPPIVGDVWVPAHAASHPRPTPGHVALIVFAPRLTCFSSFRRTVILGDLSADVGCFADAAALHRLARRFPELEITIATQTGRNTFGYLPPLSPTETARWIEHAAAAWKLPGALAIVEQSPKVRFLAPDDRIVVVSPDSNPVHYHFNDGAFVVDQDGIVVWHIHESIGFGGSRDPLRSMWITMIDVLLHRDKRAMPSGDHGPAGLRGAPPA